MTFNAYEVSVQDGGPVELFLFENGEEKYRYTSADHDVIYDGNTWVAYPIQRGPIEVTTERGRNNMSIKAPRGIPVSDIFRIQPPSNVVTITIFRLHEADPDAEAAVLWDGRVLNAKWVNVIEVDFSCEPVTASLIRPGLRRLYQRMCPHVLYGAKCGVLKTDYAHDAVLTGVAGVTLTAPAFDALADNYLAGGFIEYELPSGNYDRRSISAHTGATITINFPSTDLFVGLTVTAYPGCDHTTATCNSKFGNILNYGGMPYIPQRNPMEGSMF